MDSKAFLYQPLLGQATLAAPISFDGDGGFFDDQATIELRPAAPDTGLVFACQNGRLRALVDYVSSSEKLRTTILSSGGGERTDGWKLYTVEHLLSALFGMGITNCEIHVGDNGLIPFFDGSAHEFCDKILGVGLADQRTYYRRAVYCQQTIHVSHGDSSIHVDPPTTPGLKIEADIDFGEPIGPQRLSYVHSPLSYCLNIAWARTFATKDFVSEEATRRQLPGFRFQKKVGGYVESPMLVFKDNEFITTLRRDDEHIRHKLLDFIGDLALLGYDLYGDVKIHRPGHAINRDFVRAMRQRFDSAAIRVEQGGPIGPKYEDDKSRYVRDVTLTDGELYGPGVTLVKTWEIANVGRVPWIGRFLSRVGPCCGYGVIRSDPKIPIPTTPPGETVQVSATIETPSLQGWYLAEWKMIDADGDYVFPNRYPVSVTLRVGAPLDELMGP